MRGRAGTRTSPSGDRVSDPSPLPARDPVESRRLATDQLCASPRLAGRGRRPSGRRVRGTAPQQQRGRGPLTLTLPPPLPLRGARANSSVVPTAAFDPSARHLIGLVAFLWGFAGDD